MTPILHNTGPGRRTALRFPLEKKPRQNFWKNWFLAAACCTALLCLSAVLTFPPDRQSSKEQPTARRMKLGPQAIIPAMTMGTITAMATVPVPAKKRYEAGRSEGYERQKRWYG